MLIRAKKAEGSSVYARHPEGEKQRQGNSASQNYFSVIHMLGHLTS